MKNINFKALGCKVFATLAILVVLNNAANAQCGNYNFGSGYGTNVTYASQLANTNYTGIVGISGTFYIDVANFSFNNAQLYMETNAAIIVNDYSELNMVGITISSCTGSDMWNTIEADGANSKITISQAVIEHGKKAISLVNGAAFAIGSVQFNRNYIGLNIANGSYSAANSYLDKCRFTCELPLGSGIAAHLMAPYATQKGLRGISIANTSGLSLIASSPNSNFASNLTNGVYSNSAAFELQKMTMQDCDYGVLIKNGSTLGSTRLQFNTFTNCLNGVRATNLIGSNLTVSYNNFTQTKTGIDLNSVTGASINVINNRINYYYTGTTWKILPYTNGMFGTADYTTNGIRIVNYVKGAAANCYVKLNLINNTRLGIYIGNVNNAHVDENALDYNIFHSDLITFNSSVDHHIGIHLEGCSNSSANFNEVKRKNDYLPSLTDGTEDKFIRAIQFSQSSNGNLIWGNPIIEYISNAVIFKNACMGTTIKCNTFSQCYSGVSLGKPQQFFTANISSQGTGNSLENQWNTNQLAVPDRIRRVTEKNASNITWDYTGVGNISNTTFPAATFTQGTVQPHAVSFFITCISPVQDFGEAERLTTFGGIVAGTNDYKQHPDEYTYYDNDFYYRFFYEHPQYLTLSTENDAAFVAFYNQLSLSNTAQFYQVQLAIEAGNYQLAYDLLNAITPLNTIEQNKQTCSLIYLATFAVDLPLSEQQNTQLLTIANQLSMEGGEGVLWARAMLDIEVNEETEGGSRISIPTREPLASILSEIKVYPNPAANYLIIDIGQTDATISIIDVTGKMVLQQLLTKGSNLVLIQALSKGVYSYRISAGKAVIKNEKLVIIN